ncbi:MAG TPA: SRPBCC family protein [Gemmatimonadales bacterium]|nr:SRPBCC family protein [Gemmatimonadales bacterium]
MTITPSLLEPCPPMTAMTDRPTSTDRIEKQFEVKAKRSRVWRALADAEEFGAWFGMKLAGPFTPGATVLGQLTFAGLEHVSVEMMVQTVRPEEYFAYRWHPYALDPAIDYSKEPTTLVEFRLTDTAGGTTISIVESGFDLLPATRRAEAFRMNEGGWASQSKKLAKYVE